MNSDGAVAVKAKRPIASREAVSAKFPRKAARLVLLAFLLPSTIDMVDCQKFYSGFATTNTREAPVAIVSKHLCPHGFPFGEIDYARLGTSADATDKVESPFCLMPAAEKFRSKRLGLIAPGACSTAWFRAGPNRVVITLLGTEMRSGPESSFLGFCVAGTHFKSAATGTANHIDMESVVWIAELTDGARRAEARTELIACARRGEFPEAFLATCAMFGRNCFSHGMDLSSEGSIVVRVSVALAMPPRPVHFTRNQSGTKVGIQKRV